MATIAYLRVSTDEQADSKAGLNAQLDACTKHAGLLDAVYRDEGVSGSAGLDKRPGLVAAIGKLAKGDTLLVAKRDRLARDPLVMAMIEAGVQRKHARIVSAAGEGTEGDNPTDILMRRMVDAFAEYERLLIGARTKAALAGKRSRGERIGSVPYGYQLDQAGQMVACEAEQETVKLVRMLRDSGLSYRKIADALTDRGMQPRGASWHAQTIKNICEAEQYGQAIP